MEGEKMMKKKKYNGNQYYLLISALQKSVRWCEVNASRYFAQELVCMGKSVDALNRLILIAAEDVGIADPCLVVFERQCSDIFGDLINKYEIEKKDAFSIPEICDVVDIAAIAAATSYKSRLLPMLSFLTLYDIYKNENFKDSLHNYFGKFVSALQRDDEKQAVYYAFVIGIFLKHMPRVLSVILKLSHKRNTYLIEKWVEEYENDKENLFLVGSIVLLCRDLPFQHGEFLSAIHQHIHVPPQPAKIPDRAYDKHTRVGKKMGRGLKHFFEEAATVKNERPENIYKQEGENAYYAADEDGLGRASKLIEAIEEKRKAQFVLEKV